MWTAAYQTIRRAADHSAPRAQPRKGYAINNPNLSSLLSLHITRRQESDPIVEALSTMGEAVIKDAKTQLIDALIESGQDSRKR